MSLEFRELSRAHRIQQDAQGDLYNAIEAAFKQGDAAHYWQGEHLVMVTVESTSMDRVLVTNRGKSYWVGYYRFEEFKRAGAGSQGRQP